MRSVIFTAWFLAKNWRLTVFCFQCVILWLCYDAYPKDVSIVYAYVVDCPVVYTGELSCMYHWCLWCLFNHTFAFSSICFIIRKEVFFGIIVWWGWSRVEGGFVSMKRGSESESGLANHMWAKLDIQVNSYRPNTSVWHGCHLMWHSPFQMRRREMIELPNNVYWPKLTLHYCWSDKGLPNHYTFNETLEQFSFCELCVLTQTHPTLVWQVGYLKTNLLPSMTQKLACGDNSSQWIPICTLSHQSLYL